MPLDANFSDAPSSVCRAPPTVHLNGVTNAKFAGAFDRQCRIKIGCFEAEHEPRALFVFGDSYADTGNHSPYVPILNRPWKLPYGSTWPGEGFGRYSDGKIFTDFFVEYLGFPAAPMTARMAKGKKQYDDSMHGINFAYGGSGMFSTFGPLIDPVHLQIKQFSQMIESGFLSKDLIDESMILFVVCGNDYTAYGDKHPNDEGILDFVPSVASEIDWSLKAFQALGVKKISITKMLPYGCYPKITSKVNYISCNASENARTILHNKLITDYAERAIIATSFGGISLPWF
ncbi:hypothetical protein KP509_32G028700 [Ceratopteris richardii]|uniref:GDSL esterase/lipase n=1 Tax=Ceratopteris richardii TaxID=49495 RepID=A0A8T2QU86_CERRI|nr:hypothetical protein KP509_32G028700 [Ceratopteris richardii]